MMNERIERRAAATVERERPSGSRTSSSISDGTGERGPRDGEDSYRGDGAVTDVGHLRTRRGRWSVVGDGNEFVFRFSAVETSAFAELQSSFTSPPS